ncbi:MAG: HD domain-containing protein [bacterium]|nr:HD domain-containing protein [bacterium]
MNNGILSKVKEFIGRTFRYKGSSDAYYHNFTHTAEVAKVAEEIADAMGVNENDKEALLIAAWFHDIGHTEKCEGHEDIGIAMATKFLQENNYPSEGIDKVISLIDATRMPRNPKNILEEIICDADLHHLGTDKFDVKGELFKNELEALNCCQISDEEWLTNNLKFFVQHQFYTEYAKQRFETQKNINYIKIEKKLKKVQKRMEEEKNSVFEESKKDKKKDKEKDKEKDAGRSIETMFRNTVRTHVDFSSMADTKANIMISVNTLVLTIIVSIMVRKLDTNPHLIIPTAMLTLTSLVTLVYAILVTRPKVTRGLFTEDDIKEKKVNLLFFGNFHKMSLNDFKWAMKEMMKDKEFLYDNMIMDFYYLGQVLGQKYQKLRICYTFFMYGLIISVLAFAIAFILYPGTDLGPLIE